MFWLRNKKTKFSLRILNKSHRLTADENYHLTQHIKRLFWYLAVLISNLKKRSPNALNLVQNGNSSILSLLCGPFLLP